MRAVALVLLVAACGSSPPRLGGATLPKECREDALPDDSTVEVCGGWVLDWLFMTKVWKPYRDPVLAAYVGAVGLRVAAAARPGLAVEFRVLDDDDPQGWSLPGYVYVSRGALVHLHSEAELAGLLAHEIAHIAAGHGDDLFAPGGSTTSNSAALLSALEHERDEERQADELAVTYLERAGYRPQALASMLVALETAPRTAKTKDAYDDGGGDTGPDEHPALLARIARILRVAHGRDGALAEARFRAGIASLQR